MKILLLLSIVLVPFIVGFLDGWWKRKKTANHDIKWIYWICYLTIAYFQIRGEIFWISVVLIKPIHDLGYTYGYGRGRILEIGTTSLDDIAVRWLFGIKGDKNSNIRIVAWTYYAVIFIGISLLVTFMFYR